MKLTLIRGLPGSSKSTYAKKNFNCLILENDQFQISDGLYRWSPEGTKHAIDMVWQIVEMTLTNKSDVCIANTFVKRRFIESYKQLAKKYNADFEVIRCTGNYGNIHNVPINILDSMKANFEDWPGEILV